MTPIVGTGFVFPTTVTASSEAAGHPGSYAALLTKRGATWRTTGVGASTLTLDFGAPVALVALAILGANFAHCKIEISSNGSSWSTLITDLAPATSWRAVDYRGLSRFGTPVQVRYWRLTPTGPISGATYYELGTVACCTALRTLADIALAPQPYVRHQAVSRPEYPGYGTGQAAEGGAYLEQTIGNPVFRNTEAVKADLDFLQSLGAGPFLWYANEGDAGALFLVQRTSEMAITVDASAIDATCQVEEFAP